MNKNNWTTGGNSEELLYREDLYDGRFYIRPFYVSTKVVGWRACDRSRSDYLTGNPKALLESRNKKTAMKFIEKNLKAVDKAVKILIPYFLNPFIEIMTDEKRGWKWEK